jgi:glycosyltransferase involved in cell wall biosynthesis
VSQDHRGPLRVLHVLDELKPSGAEEMLRSSAPYWREQGVESTILATGGELGRYAPALESAGYRIVHLPYRRSMGFLREVRQCLAAGRYDVLHIHPERAFALYAAAGTLARVPTVVRTVHHIFPYAGLLRWRKALERLLCRWVLRVRYVSNSPSGARNERRRFGNRNPVIPNWYDDAVFRPPTEQERRDARAQLGIEDGTLALVTVGGCWSYKNHDLIIRSLGLLGDGPEVLYLHAGQEDPARTERAMARTLGEERVRFLGVVPDVLPLLHAADGFLMPSTIEGFGIAAVEAMAAGVPALLSDVRALWDFRGVLPGIIWVAPDAERIAEGIEQLRALPSGERRRMGALASQAAQARFGVERGAAGYLALYRQGATTSRVG